LLRERRLSVDVDVDVDVVVDGDGDGDARTAFRWGRVRAAKPASLQEHASSVS
jgi:hypothetical protein